MVDDLRWKWLAMICTAIEVVVLLVRACILGVCSEASPAEGNAKLAYTCLALLFPLGSIDSEENVLEEI